MLKLDEGSRYSTDGGGNVFCRRAFLAFAEHCR
jgi:hypothetical protein